MADAGHGVDRLQGRPAAWALERLPAGRGDALRRARDAYLGIAADVWDEAASMSARADVDAMVRAIEAAPPGDR